MSPESGFLFSFCIVSLLDAELSVEIVPESLARLEGSKPCTYCGYEIAAKVGCLFFNFRFFFLFSLPFTLATSA
ncbi:hypothetical protein Hanom_Chr09g00827081 [Helianthus anomalus]